MHTLFRNYRASDPRYYQIAVLTCLVTYGIAVLDFGIHWYNAIAIAVTAQAVQFTGSRISGTAFDARSALVTSLSLTLLLRTDSIALAAAAALIAIGSKFVVRINNKHIFNPANFAIVSLVILTDDAWVSTGQWGSATIGALALACLGFIVLTRAKRAETTISFLVAFAALLLLRSWWLSDPLVIALHHLQNGALLIFSFFMISDPKTTPNSADGRIIYGIFVATVAFAIQFIWYEPNGPILALILASPLVPVIDAFRAGPAYRWIERPHSKPTTPIERMSKPKGAF
ncbi:MAG: RnfABCDGE type electron transport complex subunit D [Gammaproteobacteria bacterium]|nr:RnfABCDGE type electron transport complex subunit D [Gammaproteobacteria bacterium]